ncbi:toll/interleukin-1 receptor domain-containing protein [Methanobrevibacter sp.]|uniref:toll/interleukin-1 receptor domain-containing protein n=1 Tax=Methanobrevibacter sp. TaxID=66852 RepID=UPI00386F8E14
MTEGHDVFISYSTADQGIADKVHYTLEENGLSCWIATNDIPSGKLYIDEIGAGIKSAKIVVLIYSSFSQASKYVKNEIHMAYKYDKPIISFNIDGSEPSEHMGYYLKVMQWLPAYPNPEDYLEKLVVDARELCNEKNDVPVVVDFTNFEETDFSKHKHDWISIALLCLPFYWASFIYMGITASKKIWVLMGLMYLIPTLMVLILYFQIWDYLFIKYPMFILFVVIFVMFWILAIIHGLVIRNEFLTWKAILRFSSTDDELFNYLFEGYINAK